MLLVIQEYYLQTLYAAVSEIVPAFIKELLSNPVSKRMINKFMLWIIQPAQEKQTSETPEPEVWLEDYEF